MGIICTLVCRIYWIASRISYPSLIVVVVLLLLEAYSLFCGLRWEQFNVRYMEFEIVTVVICASGMSVHTVKKKKNCVWIIICIVCIIFVNFLVTVQPLMLKLCDSWQGMSLYAPPPPPPSIFLKKLSSGWCPPASRPCHEKNPGARQVVELDFCSVLGRGERQGLMYE
jgi:hypothetical protein